MRPALLLLVVFLAACTPAPKAVPVSFDPPRWSAHDRSELPARLATAYVAAAVGWVGGLLVAADFPEPVLFASPDGDRWTEQAPAGFERYLRGQPMATHGSTAYVLGGGPGEIAVWRTGDGTTWDRTVLPDRDPDPVRDPDGDTAPDSEGEQPFAAIAAGPHGVLVVVPDGFELEFERAPGDFSGFDVWHSADGRSFRHTGSVPLDRESAILQPAVTATADGFLLHDTDDPFRDDTPLFRSADGVDWEPVGDGLPLGSRLTAGRIGDLTFVLGRETDDALYARYRRDGDDTWHAGHTDLGRLPDAGVVARDQQWITSVRQWGGGFLAVGRTEHGAGGLVWTSPDGIRWTRMPVRDNGFEGIYEMRAVASSRGRTYLFGTAGFPPDQQLFVWRAEGS
ncbi:hypothetical protein [Saccharothrix hoggarensis]|uniref:Uncharacterized protein n=1 Tax=Saccharothrix hoggarensis TaxID=913853 RepID=A0ABW3QZ27_9PSEU